LLSELTRARVLASYRGHWLVAIDESENRLVQARGRLTLSPIAGDWVGIDEGGAIAHVFERSGTVVRRAPGEQGKPVSAHVLAANVDLALVTEPLPDPKARRLERFAALAASGGVPVALVLTKADLDEDGYATAAALARRMGVADAVAVSAVTGEGMGIVRSLLTPGTTAVLLGASGTGKSTLVNALLGEERMKTGEVRASDRRGRHTTVTRELLALPGGASLIDTPGIRVAGLWDGTGETFADVDELAPLCRFADCGHETEPGCAVRDAIDPERLAAWRKLQRELAWVTDRRAAQRQRDEWHKRITRQLRQRQS
jgi:ribosome biogenesis GTPase / thiamine phosphate phosphatase